MTLILRLLASLFAGRLLRLLLRAPATALAAAVIVGIGWMGSHGAPARVIVGNALALVLAVPVAAMPLPRGLGRAARPLAVLCGVVLAASLLEPGTAGAHRWIGVGGLRLHAGLLLVPAIVALAARLAPRERAALVALAALVVALQPDRAGALALFAGVLALRDPLAVALAAAGLVATLLRPDTLAPRPFAEGVLQQAFAGNPALGLLLAAALAWAIAAPAWRYRAKGAPVSAALGGFALASLAGPYPSPLVGHGAAAILGTGLALAIARRR